VTFTFVEYVEGDGLGKLLAYTSLLPVFIGFGMGCVVLARRELVAISLLLGRSSVGTLPCVVLLTRFPRVFGLTLFV
jgi:hypothetical protein